MENRINKPIKRTRQKKKPIAPVDPKNAVYAQLWRLVDGAVRDAMQARSQGFVKRFHKSTRIAIVKRVTGTFMGFVNENRN